jgi:hypothetical protein
MEATLQVIMQQLKELSAGQSALKSGICAEVKSDMSEIRADLITQVHAIESKMSNCMSVIREELQTQIGDLCAAQAELEDRFDKQQKDVNSMVEQQTRNLREDIEATRRELEAKLAAVETRTMRAGGSGPGANTSRVKPPKFDGTTSWAVFYRQFEAAAVQNNWQPKEKTAHLLSVLQGQAAIVRTVPAEATYEDITGALRDCFGDHQLAAVYWSQFIARTLVRAGPRVPFRMMNVTNQDQVVNEGTTIGHGEPAMWAAAIDKLEPEPRRNQGLCKQFEEVIADARPNLSRKEAQAMEELIADYQEVFETKSGDHGRTEKVYHRIDTGDARPIRQPPRRLPLAKQAEVNDMLEDMKRKGVIEESDSPWSSPVVLIQKKDGSHRFCVDYRRLNYVTKKIVFRFRGLTTPWTHWRERGGSLRWI